MSTVICSCLLGDNAKVRLKLSKILHEQAGDLYGDDTQEDSVPVCEVEMKGCRREFYANPTGEQFLIGQPVILEADGGYDFGIVYSAGRIARKKLSLKGAGEELPSIIRAASEKDVQDFTEIRHREPEIREACHNRIERHRLDMKLVDIDLRLDQQKLSVYYTASHRVDFRGLVRDLAGEFKARIQMVQITTREEARRANTQGPCGCVLCCSSWMQKIHANPFAEKPLTQEGMGGDNHSFNTIGLCNRPKCCLNFSKIDKNGHSCRNNGWPAVGMSVSSRDGDAVVEGVDPQKKSIWIRFENGQKRRLSLEQYNALVGRK
ncbi:MAG: hypothetical protein HGB04_00690 [Chlorobiaceae bacterium]|nr:hypothetical protein [Chlorobiaceae bacterium]